MSFDKIVNVIVGLGVPGLILFIAISATGYVGAAAITAALSSLGGPLGMLGGIALIGVMVLISRALAKYGFEEIYFAVMKKLKIKDNLNNDDVINKINQSN